MLESKRLPREMTLPVEKKSVRDNIMIAKKGKWTKWITVHVYKGMAKITFGSNIVSGGRGPVRAEIEYYNNQNSRVTVFVFLPLVNYVVITGNLKDTTQRTVRIRFISATQNTRIFLNGWGRRM